MYYKHGTRWHIQVNSSIISLLTEAFVYDIVQNCLTRDDEVKGQIILETAGKL